MRAAQPINRIRTLHIDIEGGWGGSSRSLFELVRRLDRGRIEPMVAYRECGPASAWYAEIGVESVHIPAIASYVPRRRKALKNLVASLPRLSKLRSAAEDIASLARHKCIDLIHLNYEGLFLLGKMLKRRTALPVIAHCRAHLPQSIWGKWLVRSLARSADHVFFISPQEASRWNALAAGPTPNSEVLWNIAREAVPRGSLGTIPEVVYLGNLDPVKGVDRLIDIAAALDRIGAPPLRIAAYGAGRNRASMMLELESRVEREALRHRIEFRGHTADPMKVLATALALVRPSRDEDPWGRDVIEAMAAGTPVLATGTYEGVVRHGVDGFLFSPFDADAMAARLRYLALNPDEWTRLSASAGKRGNEKFGGVVQAARFSRIVEQLASGGKHRGPVP